MALCHVQLESQWRPVSAALEPAVTRGAPCVIKVDGVECFGRVVGPRPGGSCPGVHLAHLVRMGTPEDVERRVRHRVLEEEAFAFFREQARLLKLALRPAQVQVAFDESKLLFFYTAENKVDFRELVRILAQRFHARIEMRQVGVRDEARLRGGYGHCGQTLCCARHLRQFQPVTIRMAKDQGLSLNPAKISGLCGRLMCCLRYEAPLRPKDAPKDTSKDTPKDTAPPAGE